MQRSVPLSSTGSESKLTIAPLPDWLVTILWAGTPFPALLQAPLDVLVERGGTGHGLVLAEECHAEGCPEPAVMRLLVLERAGRPREVAACRSCGRRLWRALRFVDNLDQRRGDQMRRTTTPMKAAKMSPTPTGTGRR